MISLLSGQFTTNLSAAKTQAIGQVQSAQNLPPQAKEPIIAGLEKSSTKTSGSDTTNNEGVTNQNNPLNNQIAALFNKAILDSFTFVWFAAAMFALFGVIPALFTGKGKPRTEAPVEDPEEPEEAMEMVA